MWLPAQFVPIFFLDVSTVVFRRLFDVGESLIAIGIRDPLDLVKAGQGILDMRGVRQRLLPLPRESVDERITGRRKQRWAKYERFPTWSVFPSSRSLSLPV